MEVGDLHRRPVAAGRWELGSSFVERVASEHENRLGPCPVPRFRRGGRAGSTVDRSGRDGRSRRSTASPGEPDTWGRAAAVSRRDGGCNAERCSTEWWRLARGSATGAAQPPGWSRRRCRASSKNAKWWAHKSSEPPCITTWRNASTNDCLGMKALKPDRAWLSVSQPFNRRRPPSLRRARECQTLPRHPLPPKRTLCSQASPWVCPCRTEEEQSPLTHSARQGV